MYAEFEKLNCQHIKELNAKNNQNTYVMQHYNYFNNNCIPYDITKESHMLQTPHLLDTTHCTNYDSIVHNTSNNDYCCGYECLTSNSFYHEPDKKNTYHNYLVLQDELYNDEIPFHCTENHQIFRNWTRRKLPVMEKDVFFKSKNTNTMDEYFQELPKLKMHKCDMHNKLRYMC